MYDEDSRRLSEHGCGSRLMIRIRFDKDVAAVLDARLLPLLT
jgi:hypothetical protein